MTDLRSASCFYFFELYMDITDILNALCRAREDIWGQCDDEAALFD